MPGVIRKALSRMPSGAKISSRIQSPSFRPLAISSIRPAQSMPMPYSQREPGSNISGERSMASLQVLLAGMPSAWWQRQTSSLQRS